MGPWLLVVSVYLFFFGLIGSSSIIARYSSILGSSVSETGFMFSIAPLVSLLLRIPVGILADRYGSHVFMALGSLALAVSGFLASVSDTLPALLLVRALQGVAIAMFIGPSIAAASNMPYRGGAARLLSYRASAISLAAVTGPVALAYVTDYIGFSEAFIAASAAGIASAVSSGAVARYLAVPRREAQRWSMRALATRSIALVAVIALIDGAVFITLQALPQEHVARLGMPARIYGLYLSISGIIGFFSRILAGELILRLGPLRVAAVGLAIEGLSNLVLAAWDGDPLILYASGAIYGVGLGLVVPSEQYFLLSGVRRDARNTAASIYAASFDLGGFAGVGGFSRLAESHGYAASYTGMALLGFLGSMIAAGASRGYSRQGRGR